MTIGSAPRRLVKYAIAAPIAPPPQITMRLRELMPLLCQARLLSSRAAGISERVRNNASVCHAGFVSGLAGSVCVDDMIGHDGGTKWSRNPRHHVDGGYMINAAIG